ncbi:MAG TPA: hypothetical protein PLZ93_00715 [Nocardioides sp.]|uniref:hypothetical protein n=1 Tax=uncultured Nocardioides sp. TaxID=198441 RepID=UPI002622C88F|nr:hypothetical protein [uncultured Nocardioides sp.]HRI94114.1 hypothetical protein [Nocardioides sp.]HRK44104.1 hypothetical protein [Nocardioides sp.]
MSLLIDRIVSHADVVETSRELERLTAAGRVEYLVVSPADVARHRLRLVSDSGTECLVALPRDEHLSDGAVLLLESDRALVARVQVRAWIRLRVRDAAAGLRLGHLAGHLHWAVQFHGDELWVGADDPEDAYLARLEGMLEDGSISVWRGAPS